MENDNVNNKKKQINQRHIKKEFQSNSGITGNEFDDINFDEKNEINIIINNMKNNKNSQFLIKRKKFNIFRWYKNFLDEKKNEKENEILFLQRLIDLSVPITKKFIKEISYENSQKEIQFNNLEINIIFDWERIINTYHK